MPKIVTDADRDIRRQAIIHAAASEFARLGFDQANINVIAEKAGIGKGTIYLYFDNKQALFNAMLADIAAAHVAQLEAVLSAQPDFVGQLRALLATFIRLAAEEPDSFRVYMSALYGVNRQFQNSAAQHYAAYVAVIEEMLAAAMERDEISRRPVAALALLVLNVTESLVLRAAALNYPPDFVAQQSETIIATLLYGLTQSSTGLQ